MISYMQIKRICEEYAVCEVERVPTDDAFRIFAHYKVQSFLTNVPFDILCKRYNLHDIHTGQVYLVYHTKGKVEDVINYDKEETLRRQQAMVV